METIHEIMAVSPVFTDEGRTTVKQMADQSNTKPVTKADLQAAFNDLMAALSPEERRQVRQDIHAQRRERLIQSLVDNQDARTKARQLFTF